MTATAVVLSRCHLMLFVFYSPSDWLGQVETNEMNYETAIQIKPCQQLFEICIIIWIPIMIIYFMLVVRLSLAVFQLITWYIVLIRTVTKPSKAHILIKIHEVITSVKTVTKCPEWCTCLRKKTKVRSNIRNILLTVISCCSSHDPFP